MTSELKVVNIELAYEGKLREPVIRLLSAESGILDSLYKHLAPFGARLSDLKVDTQGADISQASVSCGVYNFTGTVQVYADRVTARAISQPAGNKFFEIVTASLSAVRAVADTAEVASHGLALSVHATPVGSSAGDLLDRFIKSVSLEKEEPSSASVSYSFGQSGSRLNAFFSLEPSLAVQDGIFIRMFATYDASSTSADEAARKALDLLNRVQSEVLDIQFTEVEFHAP